VGLARLLGIFISQWANSSNFASYPPLVVTADKKTENFLPAIEGAEYRAWPLSPDNLEPSWYAKKIVDFYNWKPPNAFMPFFPYQPFSKYHRSATPVGKVAQALLYCAFWPGLWKLMFEPQP